ncbi:5-hydroxytryptamine receptor 1F isoform X3 [Halichoerus grypus]
MSLRKMRRPLIAHWMRAKDALPRTLEETLRRLRFLHEVKGTNRSVISGHSIEFCCEKTHSYRQVLKLLDSIALGTTTHELRREGEIKVDCEPLADFSQEQEHEEAEW